MEHGDDGVLLRPPAHPRVHHLGGVISVEGEPVAGGVFDAVVANTGEEAHPVALTAYPVPRRVRPGASGVLRGGCGNHCRGDHSAENDGVLFYESATTGRVGMSVRLSRVGG